jgi:hypothetical protein
LGEVAPEVELNATAMKFVPSQQTDSHCDAAGIVREVHVMPSGEVAAVVDP